MKPPSCSNRVILLVGPKGSGKTHIGSLLEQRFPQAVHFVRVELIFMSLQKENPDADMATLADLCYQQVAQEVQEVLAETKNVTVLLEVTGVAPQLVSLIETLKSRHCLQYVKVIAPGDVCLKRVQERDASQQVSVSEERIKEINQLASAVVYPWDLQIDNSALRSDEEILKLFTGLW